MRFRIHSEMSICTIFKSQRKTHCSCWSVDTLVSTWVCCYSCVHSWHCTDQAPGLPRVLPRSPGGALGSVCWARPAVGGLGLAALTQARAPVRAHQPGPPGGDPGSPVPFPLTSTGLAATRHFRRMDCRTLINTFWPRKKKGHHS